MNTYTITSPSIEGVLSHNDLYFEGIRRPLVTYMARDVTVAYIHPDQHQERIIVLERYFEDIHALFMKKLAIFSSHESVADDDVVKLRALFHEMIKVKGLIDDARERIT